MWEEVLKAVPVMLFSMVKFIFGPTMGYAVKLHVVTTILATVIGMMTSVMIFTFFGDWLRKRVFKQFFARKSKQGRRTAMIWRKYGLPGIAAITPLILTPIGGTLIAISFGSPKDRIIIYMFISASVWSIVISFLVYIFGNSILPNFIRP